MRSVLALRDFRLFWSGGLLSVAGDWMLLTALPFYVYALTGSAAATSVMYVAYAVPKLALGLVGGALVDRFDRKHTMVVCDVSRAVLLLPLLFVGSGSLLWLLVAVSAVQSSIGQLFFPARSALLPSLVPSSRRPAANSLDTLSMGLTRLLGPISGGAVLAGMGIRAVVVIDAASFLVSALLLSRMHVRRLAAAPAAGVAASRPGILADLRDGVLVCARRPRLRAVLGTSGLVMVGYGLVSVLLVVFVRTHLGGSAADFGAMTAAQGVGLMLGGLLGTVLAGKAAPGRLYTTGLVVTGAAMLLAFRSTALAPACVLFGLSGLGLCTWMIGERTLLQSAVGPRRLGRVFGAYNTLTSALMLTGTVLAGVLGGTWGARSTLTLAALLYLVPGLVGMAALAVARPRRRTPEVVEQRRAS